MFRNTFVYDMATGYRSKSPGSFGKLVFGMRVMTVTFQALKRMVLSKKSLAYLNNIIPYNISSSFVETTIVAIKT